MTTLQDTIRIHKGYMRDPCWIHAGYMRDTCPRYILGYMYLKCILRGTYLRSRIHAGYMRDTCICKGNQDTYVIHPRYMMRYMSGYMYIKFVPARIQGPSAPASRARDTYPRMYPYVSDMYR